MDDAYNFIVELHDNNVSGLIAPLVACVGDCVGPVTDIVPKVQSVRVDIHKVLLHVLEEHDGFEQKLKDFVANDTRMPLSEGEADAGDQVWPF